MSLRWTWPLLTTPQGNLVAEIHRLHPPVSKPAAQQKTVLFSGRDAWVVVVAEGEDSFLAISCCSCGFLCHC